MPITHLCHNCAKAEDGSCDAYEQLTSVVDEYFEDITIQFTVTHCEFFEEK